MPVVPAVMTLPAAVLAALILVVGAGFTGAVAMLAAGVAAAWSWCVPEVIEARGGWLPAGLRVAGLCFSALFLGLALSLT